ncbi:nuclear factor NF-kappa-B p105 subunit [Boleophthalmus pectinirostris]|uniref:nuclear factor NF-kappa-B p105 subunit n=1 Tax=Boleophthalmus pectinirostris TaxID=150288 RepID=UPI00242B06CD|nr:nuclear factor NF-kappa-B p105 subunit [Boleophthalmus pectinirostris]
MATDDPYLHPPQMFEMMDPTWDYNPYPVLTQNPTLRTVDGPYLQIIEQPKQRGFRFRYGCEGPSHGGLPGASSEKNRKTYPTVKICNYQGPARVVVQLVTVTHHPQLHAHSLVGKQCDKGICIADLQPKDSTISFPNLGILHVTKKNVAKTLEERMVEAFKMGYNCGVQIHPDIDAQQGEVRTPRELTDQQRSLISSVACLQSKEMDLSVVRLMFTAFLPDSDGGFSRRLEPVVSEPIYDSKAPNASNLKIVRMDRTAGCVTGGEEVYLLCDKVQKDDIQVRFYEEDNSGVTWQALGDFSPTDVHRQFAIVFKTPKYRDLNLQKPTSVFVQLKRKSDNETSEPKPFTYHPQIIGTDKTRTQVIGHARRYYFVNLSLLYLCVSAGYYQNFTSFNYGSSGAAGGFSGGYSASLGSGAGAKHASRSSSADDGDPDDDSSSGAVLKNTTQKRDSRLGQSEEGAGGPPADRTDDAARRQVEALFQFSVSGNPAFLLAPQRHLLSVQDEDGDTGLHLAVLHSQQEALQSLIQVLSVFSTEELLNMRNHLYQTPLHLAVLTQQKDAVDTLLLAGADPALTDRHGNTALHLATAQEVGDMTSHLLQRPQVRALMGVANTAGQCPLHMAVLSNRLSSLRSLLQSGADVELQERTSGRTPLHLATEADNVSLAGCLLLEGNARVDSCTFDGSTPLHVAAGRGSAKLTALLMAAGADPLRENLEPLYMCEEEEEDEGYVPGTTPLNMAANAQVLELLNGKEYEPKPPQYPLSPPQGDLCSLELSLKQEVCRALDTEGLWETLSHGLGLGILNNAFRLSSCPAKSLLDSYEVSGGTVKELMAALKSVGGCTALNVLQEAQQLSPTTDTPQDSTERLPELLQDLKLDVREDSGLCDSGVELSVV